MSFVVDETGLEYTFNGEVWVSEGQEIDLTHDHDDQYASKSELSEVKGDVESLELELELLATTLESGTWRNIATPAPRAGEMWLAFTDFSVQDNSLIINNEDSTGTTHGWTSLHEGDYLELLDRSDTTTKTVEHDYALFMVKSVDKGDGITTIELELHSGKGNCAAGELFEVRVLDIAESELDMASLDARYLRSGSGSHQVDQNWKIVSNNKTFINIQGDKSHIYHLDTPGDRAHAANKGYVDDELAKKSDTHTHPYAASSHSHSYASTGHKHDSDYSASNHTHSVIFRSGTSTNPSLSKGEPFLNTTYKVIYVGT